MSLASRVSIVIPTFNKVELTVQCLETLRATAPEAETIVVDNASTDGTPAFLAAEHEAGRIVAILNPENRFFGPASNQGAVAATRELVLFLNNDTVPRPGFLEAMVECLDSDPAVGAVGSRLLYPDGRVQHAGMRFDSEGRPFHPWRLAAADDPAVLVDRDCPSVTGACLLLPRALYFEIGGFDEDYVMYVEDVDLCLRVWAAGRRVRYCAHSVVEHLESASTDDLARRDALVVAGWSRLHERWGGAWPEAVVALPGWPAILGGVPADTRLPGARRFTVAAFADEISERPALLGAYGGTFGGDHDVTLAVLSPPGDAAIASVEAALEAAGLDPETCADLMVVPAEAPLDRRLAVAIDAVYTEQPLDGPLAALPRFARGDLGSLAALAEAA